MKLRKRDQQECQKTKAVGRVWSAILNGVVRAGLRERKSTEVIKELRELAKRTSAFLQLQNSKESSWDRAQ